MKPSERVMGQNTILVLILLSFLLAGSLPATAASVIPKQIVPEACTAGGSGCTLCHVGELVINLTNYLMFGVALPATALLVTIGGIMLLISGASEERRTLGKKILTSTIVGLIIVLIAWLGVDTIIRVLTGTNQLSQLGPWNEFKVPAGGCPI